MDRIIVFLLALAWGAAIAQSPYRASVALDVPLAVGATGVAAFGQYRLAQMEPLDTAFHASNLLPWDRPFAGTWSSRAGLASDVMSVVGVAPLVLGGMAWKNGTINGADFGVQALMLYEVLALQSGINLTVRSLRVWPRPFMLGNKGGDERNEGQAAGSFYSGHSSAAFAIAVFTGVWFDDVYAGSKWSSWVWVGSLTTAATVASMRVAAGKHYPSDIIVGALMGSLLGWGVPALHRRSSNSASAEINGSTSAHAYADQAWLRWQGWRLSPSFLGWQCGF